METVDRWIRDASQGDEPALERLLERYLPAVQAMLRARAGGLLARESARDLAQSVCRDILENLGRFQFDGEDGFRRWLFKTAYRKMADRRAFHAALKRREAAPGTRPVDTGESALDSLDYVQSLCTPSRHAIAREDLERVEAALFELPDEQRDAVLLSRLVGLPRADVATELGRSEESVRGLVYRGLARLAEALVPPSAT